MGKLIESFMSKVFFKILDNFLRKELDGYKFVYLTTDLRGLLKKYYPMSANELSKLIIKCLLMRLG